MSTIAAAQLRSIVERVERLAEERQTIADDIADVYREAKGIGLDVKVIKRVIALRRQGKAEREEFDAILDVYLAALGMIPTFEPEAPRVHVHENPFEQLPDDVMARLKKEGHPPASINRIRGTDAGRQVAR